MTWRPPGRRRGEGPAVIGFIFTARAAGIRTVDAARAGCHRCRLLRKECRWLAKASESAAAPWM